MAPRAADSDEDAAGAARRCSPVVPRVFNGAALAARTLARKAESPRNLPEAPKGRRIQPFRAPEKAVGGHRPPRHLVLPPVPTSTLSGTDWTPMTAPLYGQPALIVPESFVTWTRNRPDEEIVI
jgi:hypothetical protein